MASRFQNVTDADVGAIRNAAGNFSLLLAIYNLHNLLQFMLQTVFICEVSDQTHINLLERIIDRISYGRSF